MNDDNKKKNITKTKKISVKKNSKEKKTLRGVDKKKNNPVLNETVEVKSKPKLTKIENNNLDEKHSDNNQNNSNFLIFFIIIAIILLFAIIVFHFVEKGINKAKDVEQQYKTNCVLVDYENLVRHPKEYLKRNVQVIGEVIDVTGYDDGFGNNMEIRINANQFENGIEQIITINYYDSDYNQSFLKGDNIAVYGKYIKINGNIPTVEAKYIVFRK